MQLEQITPMILTYNEEANLQDTLDRLRWAKQILLVDSFSTDRTLDIASGFPQVRVVQRQFDHFADQCNFGLEQVDSPWVLSLDADYKCDDAFAAELAELDGIADGYQARFLYGIYGKPLRGTLYPPRVVLYRAAHARYHRDGHAHRVTIDGQLGRIKTAILHDDWKSLTVWLAAQVRYANHEAEKLLNLTAAGFGWKDRIRTSILLAAPLTLVYCLIYKRLLLDGWRGVFYSLQRVFAELVLSLVLLDRKIRSMGSR
jgi:glycosyltransferase involved in cell wall biosynthesis